jgi:UPF0176 protein
MQENQIVITTFYKFIDLPNFELIKEQLRIYCVEKNLKGTILLASEGINATISGLREDIDSFYQELKNQYSITLTNVKESFAGKRPFYKMKVRLKKEIVTLGVQGVSGTNPGYYVKAEEWDDFIAGDDVILIDTRNKYEINLGSFRGAVNPMTEHFRDFSKWFDDNIEQFKGKKVAMFCTGGIRCEKSTSFAKSRGVNDVYHLDGGILGYLEKIGDKAKSWYGDCFVFDDRVAVDTKINPSSAVTCRLIKDGDEYVRVTTKDQD